MQWNHYNHHHSPKAYGGPEGTLKKVQDFQTGVKFMTNLVPRISMGRRETLGMSLTYDLSFTKPEFFEMMT